jgi:hypothetical protein
VVSVARRHHSQLDDVPVDDIGRFESGCSTTLAHDTGIMDTIREAAGCPMTP